MLSLGPGLFLAAFITLFYPVARLDGLRFVKRITRCSPFKPQCRAVADSLLWQETSKLSHYGPALWQPEPPREEQQMSCVSWGTITLPCCTAVCVCVHIATECDPVQVVAAPVKVAYYLNCRGCGWPLCSTLVTSGITVRSLRCQYDLTAVLVEWPNLVSKTLLPHAFSV